MKALDIAQGSEVTGYPGVYVLGCFDKRITFYSQQVRALSLVHALHELEYLQQYKRIAIVGAGAAGLTTAAALLLTTDAKILLFESAKELLPLQSGSDRRRLDPRIYDWPRHETTNRIADLPILDWESGPCRDVRANVIEAFEDIIARTGNRLERRLLHRVASLKSCEDDLELRYHDLRLQEDERSMDGEPERVNAVFLTFGFGIEPVAPIANVRSSSYWADAGVPAAEIAGREAPSYFVSGNGDGGLIDFVAAASLNFDHSAMIESITQFPGIDELRAPLLEIDSQVRFVKNGDKPLDIFEEYDKRIFPLISRGGLINNIENMIRPGVKLIIQTNQDNLLSIDTSILNRFAAYLTIKACTRTRKDNFEHIVCSDVQAVHDGGKYVLTLGERSVTVDEVIVRRGPERAKAREPFADLLQDYPSEHAEWLSRHGDATLVPSLSRAAKTFFRGRAHEYRVAPANHRARRMTPPELSRARSVNGGQIVWSGDIAWEDLSAAWQADDRRDFVVTLPSQPHEMKSVATAVVRLACHSSRVTLCVVPQHWSNYLRKLTEGSVHASGMRLPRTEAGDRGGAADNAETFSATDMADVLHRRLDLWMLSAINEHVVTFLRTEADPGHKVGLKIARDIRSRMDTTWRGWYDEFARNPGVLNHFLRMMVCADDEQVSGEAVQVLVGPEKLSSIIRGTVISMAIASMWTSTDPYANLPGNLRRKYHLDGQEKAWAAHGCAADRIAGRAASLKAATYAWKSHFVILSIDGELDVALEADSSFAQTGESDPRMNNGDGIGPVVFWVSSKFADALESGVDALRMLLAEKEQGFRAQIEPAKAGEAA